MISNQESLNLSPFMAIYDFVVPKDTMLSQISEFVDFSLIPEELKSKYCHDTHLTNPSITKLSFSEKASPLIVETHQLAIHEALLHHRIYKKFSFYS